MREITNHKVNGLNEALKIEAVDEPGQGGANHLYWLSYVVPAVADEFVSHPGPPTIEDRTVRTAIQFQNGPIAEHGINGISNEALLAIVEDRLKGFQSGPYASDDNAKALAKIQEAMHWLHHRTRERVACGVEGTSIV